MSTLRPYQSYSVAKAEEALAAKTPLLIVSPTGSGKSFMQLELLRRMRAKGVRHVQTVPNLDIARGMLDKLGVDTADLSEVRLRAAAEAEGIWTTKRLHNVMLAGQTRPPETLSHDEAHHSVDDTHEVLRAACGNPAIVGWTATGYRGTPEETKKLYEKWGAPWTALTLKDAVAGSYVSKPHFSVWPLVDDDLIGVSGGEFVLRQVENRTDNVLDDLALRVKFDLCDHHGRPLRPTMIRAPGVDSAEKIADALNRFRVPAVLVTGDTTCRDEKFQQATNREAVLVQVRVVGEGVDLPMRVLVDLAPTMSPVLWMQSVGRVTRPIRPGEDAPKYIACNHNLCRHAYLWEGLIPPMQIKEAQTAWGEDYKPTRRNVARAIGLEGFGRFAVAKVPMADGTCGSLYALQTPDGMHLYAVILHPCRGEPLFFEKANKSTGQKKTFVKGDRVIEYVEKLYGPWKRIPTIPEFDGYVSVKPGRMTPGMADWWARDAARFGLDPKYVPDAREFQALPICANARVSFRSDT